MHHLRKPGQYGVGQCAVKRGIRGEAAAHGYHHQGGFWRHVYTREPHQDPRHPVLILELSPWVSYITMAVGHGEDNALGTQPDDLSSSLGTGEQL